MNKKRPPAKEISRDAVVKECDAILRISVIVAVLGTALYWGLLDALAPSFAQAVDGFEIGGFLMAFGLLGAVAAAALRTVAADS
ncbi:hypothetical protein [Caballeronia sp.]|uniref:hypothetical protein n=1 Tax=Caballeronia sp. TaxID=1931223 RepID=UPI003C696AA5